MLHGMSGNKDKNKSKTFSSDCNRKHRNFLRLTFCWPCTYPVWLRNFITCVVFRSFS